MSPVVNRYLKRLILLTVILAILMAVVFGFFLKSCYINAFPFLLLFFWGFSFFIFYRMEKAADKGITKFVRARMAFTMLRLLVYILVAVLYIAFIRKSIACFVTVLGILYLVYSSFEVYMLTRELKK